MLVLENVKIVLYGFDDTLCIHKFHESDYDSEHLYNIDVLLHSNKAWSTCKPSIHMKKFMDLCSKKNMRQGLISSAMSFKHSIGKCEWVKDKYGIELENFCVGTFEAKFNMMLTIADAIKYSRDEILIVDDFWESLERAANNGFQACSPMEIVDFVTNEGCEI